jgi:hypothetical protein
VSEGGTVNQRGRVGADGGRRDQAAVAGGVAHVCTLASCRPFSPSSCERSGFSARRSWELKPNSEDVGREDLAALGGGVKWRGAHVGRVGTPFRKSLDLRFPSTLDPENFSTLEPCAPQGSWLRKHRINRLACSM